MSDIGEAIVAEQSDEKNVSEKIVDEEFTKSIQKPRKPKTQAQLDALARGRVVRASNLKKKKELREMKKIHDKEEKLKQKKQEIQDLQEFENKLLEAEELQSSDCSTEEEEEPPPRKPKRKSKPKRKTRKRSKKKHVSSRSSDESSSECDEPKRVPLQRQKSRVHYQEPEQEQATYNQPRMTDFYTFR